MTTEQTITYKMHPCSHAKCSPCRLRNYESIEIDYVTEYLDRIVEAGLLNGVFLDVGAHVGLWSLQMSEWYQCRYNIIPTIYAIEPDKDNVVQLKRNAMQAQTGIVPVWAAAWNTPDLLYLKASTHPARHRMVKNQEHVDMVRIQGIALDGMASTTQQRQCDVIKIDVEGAELQVLNGARQILMDNDQLMVVVEYAPSHFKQYGYTADQITAFMKAHDFRCARPVDAATTEKMRSMDIKRVIFVKGDIS